MRNPGATFDSMSFIHCGWGVSEDFAGSDAGDQKRIATPEAAVKAGANFLVVGRPILEAADMNKAARLILSQMKSDP